MKFRGVISFRKALPIWPMPKGSLKPRAVDLGGGRDVESRSRDARAGALSLKAVARHAYVEGTWNHP